MKTLAEISKNESTHKKISDFDNQTGVRRIIKLCDYYDDSVRVYAAEAVGHLADRDLVAGRGSDSAEAGARLPGLLAYAKTIESVREWPFDAPTLTRFFLYAAIPLGSWIGGALVERLLDAALD